ncbi:UPF0585 protein CG18661 isoform X2 [Hyposmocoma kahamanoa]|uniref:UPF0585 protein CG18661 isoform X2 n=1 Tax=Hyposmocoma kahamanoa TaxID=1477025 RepID=UPI000E6D78A7|nr:UPF0585 protein CG18661 isoform X2 [Hyposmocoma kahamanoa]
MSETQEIACDYHEDQSFKGEKLIYPAASRNKEPILQVLKRFILCDNDQCDHEVPLFLEVASGSGQHLAHFAPHFPHVKFQPTEVDENLLGSISYYAQTCPTKNILPPKQVDICAKLSNYGFKENSIDYIYNANMITYGPYSKDGVITPESNVEFHASLKSRNPLWGIRDINDLVKLAEQNNLSLIDTVEMPANNKTLVWKKD